MLKTVSQLELFIADKAFQFVCAPDSPIEHVKEALFQFQKYVGQLEDQIKTQSAAKPEVKDGEGKVDSGNEHEEGSAPSPNEGSGG